MRQLASLLCAAAIALVSAGSASAGYWEVVYDLAGSTSTTITGFFGSDTDPVTGTFTFRYNQATQSAPLTGARLVAGTQHVDIYWQITASSIPLMTLSGSTDTTLLPPSGGTPANMTGATLTLSVVADSNSTGGIHCADLGSGCTVAGFTNSVTKPQTPTFSPVPFPQAPATSFPKFVFGSTAGVGDWTATPLTITVTAGVVSVRFDYVGKEISRVYHQDALPSLSGRGLAGLGFCLALAGTSTLALRRRRRTG